MDKEICIALGFTLMAFAVIVFANLYFAAAKERDIFKKWWQESKGCDPFAPGGSVAALSGCSCKKITESMFSLNPDCQFHHWTEAHRRELVASEEAWRRSAPRRGA